MSYDSTLSPAFQQALYSVPVTQQGVQQPINFGAATDTMQAQMPAQAVQQTEKKGGITLGKILGLAGLTIAAIAGHKTYNLSKAFKAAKSAKILDEGAEFATSKTFLQNLNPLNWFGHKDAAKKLIASGYEQIRGDKGVIQETKGLIFKNGDDVVILNGKKALSKEFEAHEAATEILNGEAKKATAKAAAETTEEAAEKATTETTEKVAEKATTETTKEVASDLPKGVKELHNDGVTRVLETPDGAFVTMHGDKNIYSVNFGDVTKIYGIGTSKSAAKATQTIVPESKAIAALSAPESKAIAALPAPSAKPSKVAESLDDVIEERSLKPQSFEELAEQTLLTETKAIKAAKAELAKIEEAAKYGPSTTQAQQIKELKEEIAKRTSTVNAIHLS